MFCMDLRFDIPQNAGHHIQNPLFINYADDTQIFASSTDANVLANNINSDLENLYDWLTVNRLQLHPLKTKLMLIGSTYNLNNKSM